MIKGYYQFIKENNSDLFPEDWKDDFEIEGGKIILHHFGKGGLTELDPNFWGANRYTQSEAWWGLPRTYFYTNTDDKERVVAGTHYITKYPMDKLYPFNADPLNFYDECSKELEVEDVPVRRQVICISDKARKSGYDGMIYRWEGTFIAAIWTKVSVEEFEPMEVEDIPKDQIEIDGEMYDIPETDYVGWSIENGLSTDSRLDNDEDRRQRVIDTIKRH